MRSILLAEAWCELDSSVIRQPSHMHFHNTRAALMYRDVRLRKINPTKLVTITIQPNLMSFTKISKKSLHGEANLP
jgi:hypothetical protein